MKKTWLETIEKFNALNLSNQATTLLIITFPLAYLSVRHAVNTILFLLLVLSLLHWVKNSQYDSIKISRKPIWLALLGFSSFFISTAITQLIRGDFHIQSFDGPSRIFLAGAVFLYLLTRPISAIKLLEIALPAGLIILLFFVRKLDIVVNWGGRYSTSFVDPNTLGSQTLILGMLCFFLIRKVNQNRLLTILQLVGGFAALYISIYAGSRGGWLSLPFLLIVWIMLAFKQDFHDKEVSIKQLFLKLTVTIVVASFLLILMYQFVPAVTSRIMEAQNDITRWLSGVDYNSSVGTRLAMWEISLFQLAPLGGISGIGNMSSIAATVTELQLDPIKYKEAIFNLSFAGPHSDFLDNLLRMGYIGVAAYIITIAIPCIIFWKNRLNKDLDKRAAAHTGLYFMTGIFFCGLANGMLTHKYTCSFYGLIIACLLADILRSSKKTTYS